jgi:hydroxyethylthiazole kinase-like uncharacterized protein yjeF
MKMPFPRLRPFSASDVWAMTGPEANAFDTRAMTDEDVPQAVLMENAGRSAATVLHRLFSGARVLGLVGAGNNGGDALVAMRTLQSWGYRTTTIFVADRDREDPLLHGWPLNPLYDTMLEDAGWDRAFQGADVVVDGILGTGARGAPRARQAEAIARLNQSELPVLALDVPSGVDASSGDVAGEAVRAAVTVSFGSPKLGSLLHPGRGHVGRQVTVEIGSPPVTPADRHAFLVTPTWARERWPARETDTHKNRVGRVLIVGGQVGMAGAVILAARAAFRTGAGLVRVCSVAANREVLQAAVPEAMFVDSLDQIGIEEASASSDAIAIGPGLGTGEEARALLVSVLSSSTQPLLIDADALNLSAEGVIDLEEVSRSRTVLVTPHPGEMARILGDAGGAFGRIEIVTQAAERFQCAVLFKGAPSLVASPARPTAIDTQSSSDLAVAGIGDALAGVCAALLAQGLEADEAASVGLYVTGRAARLAGRGPGLTPSDVIQWISEARTEAGASRTDLDLPFVTFDADPAN